MKDKVYKRKPVDWVSVLFGQPNTFAKVKFYQFCEAHPSMSKNRCAYNVLKSYYSTTTLQILRRCGSWDSFIKMAYTPW